MMTDRDEPKFEDIDEEGIYITEKKKMLVLDDKKIPS